MEKTKKTKDPLTIKSCGCMKRDGILYPCLQCAKPRIVQGQLDKERQIIKSWWPGSKRGQDS